MVRIFTFSLLLAAFNSMAFAGFISVDVHKVDGVYRKTGPHERPLRWIMIVSCW